MRILQAIFKAIGFSIITATFYLMWLTGLPFVSISSAIKDRWRNFAFRYWAKSLVLLFGIKIQRRGILPTAPFFLVANHLSYLDIIVLASQLDAVFVAKSEVASWPIIGRLCRSMNTIFIDRKRRRDILRVNELIEKAIEKKQSVMFFPEGTTTDGSTLLPFKSALLEPAIKKSQAVSYAGLQYRTSDDERPASQAVCWWGEMSFLPHLWHVFQLRGFNANLSFGREAIIASNRKILAKDLFLAVKDELIIPLIDIRQEGECIPKIYEPILLRK